MIPSAERGTRVPDAYYIVDNGGRLDPAAYGLPTHKTTVFNPGRNMGVAAAWNHIHRAVDEYVIIICDDMELMPNTIAALVAAADAHPDHGFFWPQYDQHSMFGVNLLRHWAFEKIGPYDEQFHPAYFEDNDYARRMQLAGLPTMNVAGCGLSHHVGSATLKSYSPDEMTSHHSNFEANRARYIAKWGGLPGHETFQKPGGQ
jgi:GT2 family glycosyltransferase